MKRIIIIGGGLSGLTLAIYLARKGLQSLIIEKEAYPKHKVCGEYISNEVVPFLRSIECYPEKFSPPQIQRFQLSSTKGMVAEAKLDLGGFGISRYALDFFLYEQAIKLGVDFKLNCSVEEVTSWGDKFLVKCYGEIMEADLVVGAHGKRSKLDAKLKREFISSRSPYVGVKYHLKSDHPRDLIGLHNFIGGYCGISQVENDIVNMCYLVQRDKLRASGSIEQLEKNILAGNPILADILTNSEKLYDKPLVINEVSFRPKKPVENNMLMIGDAAGMIAPLCGNGMAMAIHSAKILGDNIITYCKTPGVSQKDLFENYTQQWNKTFLARLRRGRILQGLFGNHFVSQLSIQLALHAKPIVRQMIKSSHGTPF